MRTRKRDQETGMIGLGSKKGIVLVLVMAMTLLVTSSTVFFASILKQSMELIEHAKYSEQARNVAEAGINYALAKIRDEGIAFIRSDFSGSMDTGSYAVTYSEEGGRILVSSVGTVGPVSRTVTAEVKDFFPSALTKIFGAANNVNLRAIGQSQMALTGDIHANNDIILQSSGVQPSIKVTGTVSATNMVMEGVKYNASDGQDKTVYINGVNNDQGTVTEGAPRITFPVFDFETFKAEAIDSGSYYSGDTTFNGADLSPASGIVYVDGVVTIEGNCTVAGGIVGDTINIEGTLRQVKSGDRNIVIAKAGDIEIHGKLIAEEALVYAKRDITVRHKFAELEITGILTAERDILAKDVQSDITYIYKLTYPTGMQGIDEDGNPVTGLVSWNK
ncbi:MAG: hypothetical protein ABIA77_07310 [Candidatus Omnitrophota bacterium]